MYPTVAATRLLAYAYPLDKPPPIQPSSQPDPQLNHKSISRFSQLKGSVDMSASSSSAGRDEIPPLVPSRDCKARVYTWIARSGVNAGRRFYKCVNRDKGICVYMRSSEEYQAELNADTLATVEDSPHQAASYMHRRARAGESMEEWSRGVVLVRNGPDEHPEWNGHAQLSTGGRASFTSSVLIALVAAILVVVVFMLAVLVKIVYLLSR